jgi:acyl carrier protein
MSAAVLDQVRRIASELFDVPVAQLNAASSPETVESWDSVQHLNLVLELEQTFGVRFAPAEIERMQTIGAIADVISQRQE